MQAPGLQPGGFFSYPVLFLLWFPNSCLGTPFRETLFRAPRNPAFPWRRGARNGVSGRCVPKPEFGNESEGPQAAARGLALLTLSVLAALIRARSPRAQPAGNGLICPLPVSVLRFRWMTFVPRLRLVAAARMPSMLLAQSLPRLTQPSPELLLALVAGLACAGT